jgi:hypothetical protein
LQLGFEFLENAFIVVFPKLLRGVFARDSCEDLLAACVRNIIVSAVASWID